MVINEHKTHHLDASSLNVETKQILRNYLDKFYIAIYRTRLLIEITKQIGNKHTQLICQDLWVFLQNNLIVGAVIIEVFSIFDRKTGSMIKKFQKILEKNGIKNISSSTLLDWENQIKKRINADLSG